MIKPNMHLDRIWKANAGKGLLQVLQIIYKLPDDKNVNEGYPQPGYFRWERWRPANIRVIVYAVAF